MPTFWRFMPIYAFSFLQSSLIPTCVGINHRNISTSPYDMAYIAYIYI
ncbi:hypothetical protein CPL00221_CDS0064 [Escherichia phage RobRod40]